MFVEELQGSLLLVDANEFLGAFAAAALVLSYPWWGSDVGLVEAYRVFSGLLCGGGAMLGSGGCGIRVAGGGLAGRQQAFVGAR